jgi:hypothetical protein
MMQVRTKCIDAYKLFYNKAISALSNFDTPKTLKRLRVGTNGDIITKEISIHALARRMNKSPDEVVVASRLQLYARSTDGKAYLGSGFQSRMFYIRYTTPDEINHARIMQWVSAPQRDFLVYRGQNEILPDALKDSFYPIPHFFDSPVGRLPFKLDDSHYGGPGVRKYLKNRPGGEGLPAAESLGLWDPYD